MLKVVEATYWAHSCADCLLNCTACRMSIDHPGGRRLKGSSFVVDRVVDKKVHGGDSKEYSGSKLDRRDSSCPKGRPHAR